MGPGVMKMVGAGLQTTGAIWQFGSQVAGAWGSYYQTRANSKMQRLQADVMRANARQHLRNANAVATYAGDVQRSGEEAAVNRLLQLGQDVGRVYAGAAGDGIDVASRAVRQVDSAARQMAARDVGAMNRSTQQEAARHMDEAKNLRIAYKSDMAAARMREIEARFNNKIAKSNLRLNLLSAAGSLVSNIGASL